MKSLKPLDVNVRKVYSHNINLSNYMRNIAIGEGFPTGCQEEREAKTLIVNQRMPVLTNSRNLL